MKKASLKYLFGGLTAQWYTEETACRALILKAPMPVLKDLALTLMIMAS